jgi:hypothetical protein
VKEKLKTKKQKTEDTKETQLKLNLKNIFEITKVKTSELPSHPKAKAKEEEKKEIFNDKISKGLKTDESLPSNGSNSDKSNSRKSIFFPNPIETQHLIQKTLFYSNWKRQNERHSKNEENLREGDWKLVRESEGSLGLPSPFEIDELKRLPELSTKIFGKNEAEKHQMQIQLNRVFKNPSLNLSDYRFQSPGLFSNISPNLSNLQHTSSADINPTQQHSPFDLNVNKILFNNPSPLYSSTNTHQSSTFKPPHSHQNHHFPK